MSASKTDLYRGMPRQHELYDVIVAGGGSAGVVLCAQRDTLPRRLDRRLIQAQLEEMGVCL